MSFTMEYLLIFGDRANLSPQNMWPFEKEEEQCPSGVFPHQDLSHLPTCPLSLSQESPPSPPATHSVALHSSSGCELLLPSACSLLCGRDGLPSPRGGASQSPASPGSRWGGGGRPVDASRAGRGWLGLPQVGSPAPSAGGQQTCVLGQEEESAF